MKTHKGSIPENNSLNLSPNHVPGTEFNCLFTLVPITTPIIIRKCAKCKKNRFASSDKFRVNANKKVIDVWLIFKCLACENTLNINILSRKQVSSIDKTLLNAFHKNDKELAWRYAFDPAYIERDTEVDWAIDFEVQSSSTLECDNVSSGLEDSDLAKNNSFLVQSPFFLKMPIFVALKKILNISRSQLEKMEDFGKIKLMSFQEKPLTLKKSIGYGCKVKL
jgi:hypothetical protein